MTFSVKDGVGLLTLDRPAKHNALSTRMRSTLLEILEAIGTDNSVRVVVLRGNGPSFCAGVDIKEARPPEPSKRNALWTREHDNLGAAIGCLPVPVVAVLRGNVLGRGLDLALAADLRIGTPEARLAYPEVERGMIVGGGGARRLVRLVGESRAMDMVLCGKILDGRTAHEWGLVTRLVDDSELEEAALALAYRLAKQPALATYMAKVTVRSALDASAAVGAWTDSAFNVLGLSE